MFILNRFNKGISLFKRIKKTLKNTVIGDKRVLFLKKECLKFNKIVTFDCNFNNLKNDSKE